MIEDGREPLPNADPEGEGSSQTITDGEETMENGAQDDMRTLSDPVGCAILLKSLESEHLKDALPPSCDTSVLHTNPPTHDLTDCLHEDFLDSGCRTSVYHKRLSDELVLILVIG